jgi:hypothetical protein
MGVGDLQAAWEACSARFIMLVLGNLNINFREHKNKRYEFIVDLLKKINLVDMHQVNSFLNNHANNHPGHSGPGNTRRRGGHITCNQINILASGEDARQFWKVGF